MAPRSKRKEPPAAAAVDAYERLSSSVEQTQALGLRLGERLQPGQVVALRGELGSGKTTLIQGIAKGLGGEPHQVKSPTFVLMREYPGRVPLIHIDGYRMEGPSAAAWLDLDLLFVPSKVTVIEWAERFAGLLPESRVEIELSHVSANRRSIRISAGGPAGAELLASLRQEPEVEGTEPTETTTEPQA